MFVGQSHIHAIRVEVILLNLKFLRFQEPDLENFNEILSL